MKVRAYYKSPILDQNLMPYFPEKASTSDCIYWKDFRPTADPPLTVAAFDAKLRQEGGFWIRDQFTAFVPYHMIQLIVLIEQVNTGKPRKETHV